MSLPAALAALRDGFTVRVFTGVAAPLALLAVVFNLVWAQREGAVLTRLMLSNGSVAARLLAQNARLPAFAEDREQLHALARLLLRDPLFSQVQIYNAQRAPLASVSRVAGEAAVTPPPPTDPFAAAAAGGVAQGQVIELRAHYLFWQPILGATAATAGEGMYFATTTTTTTTTTTAPEVLGYVALYAEKGRVALGVSSLLWSNVLLMGLFLGIAAVATLLVVGRALRPLRRVARSVRERSHALPGAPPADGGRDTYTDLVRGLDRAFAAVDRLNRNLEDTVAERTAELRHANRELERARDELEERVRQRTAALEETHQQLAQAEKLSAIGKISASVAHEFNNPVCGIRNIIEELKRGSLDPDERDLAELAVAECDRIARLIRDLQQFSRPSAGMMVAVDVHAALDTMLRLLSKELSQARVQVVREYAAELPPVHATEDQLKQVFLNLLQNARDAMGEDGGTVTVRTACNNGQVRVEVADTGPGIAPEHLPHLFEPFFTTKPAVKGTGLGLSVSHGIVRRHGGTLCAHSPPGGGAHFILDLPIGGEDP